jgi:hypothetical protein
MANEITVSQLAGSIPDVVRAVALKARYARVSIAKNVLSVDADVAKQGDRVSLSILPALDVNNVGSGGSVTRQAVSLTAVEVVMNLWKECTVDVDDRAMRQSALSVLKEYSAEMGKALGAAQDGSLADEYSNLTDQTAIGSTSNPDPMNDENIRAAMQTLDDDDIPREDRMWFLSPAAHNDLLGLARFTEAQNTGFNRGVQIENGRISRLYGDPVYVSNKIATSTSAKANIYCHKEALGIGTQRNFKVTPLAKVQLSEAITCDVLYGVKTVRGNHGVVVYSSVNA